LTSLPQYSGTSLKGSDVNLAPPCSKIFRSQRKKKAAADAIVT